MPLYRYALLLPAGAQGAEANNAPLLGSNTLGIEVTEAALGTCCGLGNIDPQLNGWPMRSPADASPAPSRVPAHGAGPMWFANPSSQWTFTTYSLPISRRTPQSTPFGISLPLQSSPGLQKGEDEALTDVCPRNWITLLEGGPRGAFQGGP